MTFTHPQREERKKTNMFKRKSFEEENGVQSKMKSIAKEITASSEQEKNRSLLGSFFLLLSKAMQ